MSTNLADEHDPEDMFKDTRMSFGDHIEDLRTHLFRALKGFAIGMIFGFWPLGPYVLDIINAPVVKELNAFKLRKLNRNAREHDEKLKNSQRIPQPMTLEFRLDRRQLAEGLGIKLEDLPSVKKAEPGELEPMIAYLKAMIDELEAGHLLEDDLAKGGGFIKVRAKIQNPWAVTAEVQRQALELNPTAPTTLGITEMFFVYMKISIFTGLVISSPWVFYQIWTFIAAGLYPNEKKLVNVYMPFSLFLFISGVLLCEFFAMAQAVKAMLWFNEWLDTDADIRLNEWLSFAIMMPVVFGLAFQTPLVMMFLHKVGVVTVAMLRKHRHRVVCPGHRRGVVGAGGGCAEPVALVGADGGLVRTGHSLVRLARGQGGAVRFRYGRRRTERRVGGSLAGELARRSHGEHGEQARRLNV